MRLDRLPTKAQPEQISINCDISFRVNYSPLGANCLLNCWGAACEEPETKRWFALPAF